MSFQDKCYLVFKVQVFDKWKAQILKRVQQVHLSTSSTCKLEYLAVKLCYILSKFKTCKGNKYI